MVYCFVVYFFPVVIILDYAMNGVDYFSGVYRWYTCVGRECRDYTCGVGSIVYCEVRTAHMVKVLTHIICNYLSLTWSLISTF